MFRIKYDCRYGGISVKWLGGGGGTPEQNQPRSVTVQTFFANELFRS